MGDILDAWRFLSLVAYLLLLASSVNFPPFHPFPTVIASGFDYIGVVDFLFVAFWAFPLKLFECIFHISI